MTGVAQVKVIKTEQLLNAAAEQFLGRSIEDIHMTILQTVEGHLRAILGTLTIEEIFTDRELFAQQVTKFDYLEHT